MQNLEVIEVKGIRVLTSKQLAECYESTPVRIKQNFSENRGRFVDGKHYISLTGDELKAFKKQVGNSYLVANRASHLYLWTEKGALLHAKSLNTDKAWEVYDYLVDFYFRAKEQLQKQEPKKQVPVENPLMKSVVDIPVNEKAHKAIETIRNDMKGIEVLLNLCDRYTSEDEYRERVHVLGLLGFQVYDDIYAFTSIKPGIVVKRM